MGFPARTVKPAVWLCPTTVTFPAWLLPALNGIARVIECRPGIQVSRADAQLHVAAVEDHLAIRDGPVFERPSHAMSQEPLPVTHYIAVLAALPTAAAGTTA